MNEKSNVTLDCWSLLMRFESHTFTLLLYSST